MRSKVDLPQPDGPRMVMKSLVATSSVVGSKATVGGLPSNTRPTPWIDNAQSGCDRGLLSPAA
jgi:hypothetical protein